MAAQTYCFGPGLRSSSIFLIISTSPERWRRRLACKLGKPTNLTHAGALGRATQIATADEFVTGSFRLSSRPAMGAKTLEAMSQALNQRGIGRFRHMASPSGAFFVRVAPSALLLRRSKPVPAEPGAASCERPKHAVNWSNIRWNAAITDQPAISELNITKAVHQALPIRLRRPEW
jgi:hypothetical protein